MQKQIKTIYIPDFIPNLSLQSDFYRKICHDNQFVVFNWDFNNENKENYKIEIYTQQLLEFINQYANQDVKIIIDGFSTLIYLRIEQAITANVKHKYIINPFGRNLFFLTFNIKQKFLPNNIKLTIFKYIYLFDNLDPYRTNEKWLKAINLENSEFTQSNILFHKIFDQILNFRQIKQYHNWINSLTDVSFIVGKKNPFIQSRLLTCNNKELILIDNAGFCIHWEQPDQLFQLLKG